MQNKEILGLLHQQNHDQVTRRANLILTLVYLVFFGLVAASFLTYELLHSDYDSHRYGCEDVKSETYATICTNHRLNLFHGTLCHDLCGVDDDYDDQSSRAKIRIEDCSATYTHNGKDSVVFTNQGHVIKSRVFTIEELLGEPLDQFTESQAPFLLDSLPKMLRNFRKSASKEELFQTITPWTFNGQLNQSALLNLWLLSLQNEYVLSRMTEHILPRVVGTCGHFYAVEKLNHVIDISYFLPYPLVDLFSFKIRTWPERVQLALDLLDFLQRFLEASSSLVEEKLELCDVKYSHFGYSNSPDSLLSSREKHKTRKLLLLDGDMILTRKVVEYSISRIPRCVTDDDCYLVDCLGRCQQPNLTCTFDTTDTDLKRLCRNMFFMGKFAGLRVEAGLLVNLWNREASFEAKLEELRKLCFDPTNSVDNNRDLVLIQKMRLILKSILL